MKTVDRWMATKRGRVKRCGHCDPITLHVASTEPISEVNCARCVDEGHWYCAAKQLDWQAPSFLIVIYYRTRTPNSATSQFQTKPIFHSMHYDKSWGWQGGAHFGEYSLALDLIVRRTNAPMTVSFIITLHEFPLAILGFKCNPWPSQPLKPLVFLVVRNTVHRYDLLQATTIHPSTYAIRSKIIRTLVLSLGSSTFTIWAVLIGLPVWMHGCPSWQRSPLTGQLGCGVPLLCHIDTNNHIQHSIATNYYAMHIIHFFID